MALVEAGQQQYQGPIIVKSWNDDKGFGFIGPAGGEGQDLFVLRQSFGGWGQLVVGAEVTYTDTVETRKPGQWRAVGVTGPGVDKYGGSRPFGVPQGHVRGVVMSWNHEKGFGFISPPENSQGSGDAYVHRSDFCANTQGGLLVGQTVYYRPEQNPKKPGQIVARGVMGPGVDNGTGGTAGAITAGPGMQSSPGYSAPAPAAPNSYGGGNPGNAAPYGQASAPPPATRPRPPLPPGLPPGWEEFTDDNTGLPYWHCAATGKSVWERPGGPVR
eukprot:TRINITY_DN2109_c0_g1_i1.p1 TRINITY_DN2109_c0_g1~~TRINITY_DN2109_c0_g1_i1.p1  ORF type:complete len:305 (+),score=48.31 TRINITY_DN2109_c0_g1_i1:101-916(+)